MSALEGLPPRLKAHLRSRVLPFGAVAVCAGLTAGIPAVPEPTPRGVADALGAASGSVVAEDGFIWAPSAGAVADATWGREVTFLARAASVPDAPRDVLRARVAVTPGGRPLRVQSVARETSTPLADEHDLVAHGELVAWATRGSDGEHGATLSAPGPSPWRAALEGASPAPRIVDVVLAKPAELVELELRAEGLVLAVRDGESAERVLVARDSQEVTKSGEMTEVSVVRRARPARPPSWPAEANRPRRPEPRVVDVPTDTTMFPPPFAWHAVAAPEVAVPSEQVAPAAVVRAVVQQARARVILTGFDMRQLALRVVPAPAGPAAIAGLAGTGRLPVNELPLLVGSAAVIPVAGASPGASERGRVLAPLSDAAPRISATERGIPSFAPTEGDTPWGAVQTSEPAAGEPVAAWCATDVGAVVVAVAEPPERAAIESALAPLRCRAMVWVADRDAEPRIDAPRGRDFAPFAAFLRARAFPDGRAETWKASPGRQPSPAFRPAVLEREETVLGERVRVVAFAAGRFSWVIRAGERERSHRQGGTFPTEIEAPLLARSVATIDLGIGERRRPHGLTIGGSTGHAYASRGAVLRAGEGGLVLVPSSEARGDPQGDATELPLTASGGAPTPRARVRGLAQRRGDLCVLPDGTALVALGTFDSHEATAEALCRLGCTEVAGLDRGMDAVPQVERSSGDPLPATRPLTRLVALERGSSVTP